MFGRFLGINCPRCTRNFQFFVEYFSLFCHFSNKCWKDNKTKLRCDNCKKEKKDKPSHWWVLTKLIRVFVRRVFHFDVNLVYQFYIFHLNQFPHSQCLSLLRDSEIHWNLKITLKKSHDDHSIFLSIVKWMDFFSHRIESNHFGFLNCYRVFWRLFSNDSVIFLNFFLQKLSKSSLLVENFILKCGPECVLCSFFLFFVQWETISQPEPICYRSYLSLYRNHT